MLESPRIVLHIGSEKTGSTSLQWHIFENRQKYLEQGLYFSQVFGEQNHKFLVDYVCLKDIDESKRATIRSALVADYSAAAEKGSRFYLLSCELVSSHVNNRDRMLDFLDLVALCSSKIQVICYFRPQVDQHISRMSTVILGGRYVDAALFWNDCLPENYYYNYYEQSLLWSEYIPEKLLDFRPILGRDIVADMLPLLGVTPVAAARDWKNKMPDISTLALLNAVNYSYLGNPRPHIGIASGISCVTGLVASLTEYDKAESAFEESNKKFCGMHEEFSWSHFRGNQRNYTEFSNIHLLESLVWASGPLSELLRKYNDEYYYYRLKTNYLELQLAVMCSSVKNQEDAIQECDKIIREIAEAEVWSASICDLVAEYMKYRVIC
jgi:hypothetical protein